MAGFCIATEDTTIAKRFLRFLLSVTILTLSLPSGMATASSDVRPVDSAFIDSVDPQLLSQIGGATRTIFTQGNYALIGESSRLVILDISKYD